VLQCISARCNCRQLAVGVGRPVSQPFSVAHVSMSMRRVRFIG
jgi:hypothetical protein